MAEGVKIGSGHVDISADMSNFDNAMDALPKKAASKMQAAMKSLQAQVKKTELELKIAYNKGDLEAQMKLAPILENLRAKVDAVTRAATSQAQAIQNVARAHHAAAEAAAREAAEEAQLAAVAKGMAARSALAHTAVPGGPRDPRAVDIPDYSTWTKKGRIDFAMLGATGQKAGQDVRAGAANGAMGLMMLSQAIDDAQYGKPCRAAA